MPRRDEEDTEAREDPRVGDEVVLVLGGTGVECVTMACCRGCPDGEERPVEEARVERAERTVREPALEEPEVGARLVPSRSGRLVLMCL